MNEMQYQMFEKYRKLLRLEYLKKEKGFIEHHDSNIEYYKEKFLNITDEYKFMSEADMIINFVEILLFNKNFNISEWIKSNLNYKTYLKTFQWNVISEMKKFLNYYKCDNCDLKTNLQTHHKNYKNIYSEALNINDLTVMCVHCHSKTHNIIH